MNYSALTSQALSAPPYLVAFLFVILAAFLSDRSRNRSFYIIFHALLGGFGYLFIAIAGALRANSGWRYAGVYPAAAGFFTSITLILTWTLNNQDSYSKRGTGVAMLNLVGQFGPLVGTRLYPDSDKPYYVTGMTICSIFMFVVVLLACWLRNVLARENRMWSEAIETSGKPEEEALVDQNASRTKARIMNIL